MSEIRILRGEQFIGFSFLGCWQDVMGLQVGFHSCMSKPVWAWDSGHSGIGELQEPAEASGHVCKSRSVETQRSQTRLPL